MAVASVMNAHFLYGVVPFSRENDTINFVPFILKACGIHVFMQNEKQLTLT